MNRDPENKECQKDPIFLLQRRSYTLTCPPLWLAHDDASFWIEYEHLGNVDTSEWNFMSKGEVDEKLLYEYLCSHDFDDLTAAVERWITESVWLTRDEAEQHAKSTEYRYQFGSLANPR